MGERVAFYQNACECLEEARKLSSSLPNKEQIDEALAFTLDVVEGKRKAAKNENEFIYHEDVPEKSSLQEVKGASLVKGIPFNINDSEVIYLNRFLRIFPLKVTLSFSRSGFRCRYICKISANGGTRGVLVI